MPSGRRVSRSGSTTHDLRPRRGQQLDVLGVAEGEGLATEDGDPDRRRACRPPGRRSGARFERGACRGPCSAAVGRVVKRRRATTQGRVGQRAGQRRHRVEVDVRRPPARPWRPPPPSAAAAVLGRGDEPQVPRRHGERLAAGQRAEHRQPDLGRGRAQHLLVPGRPDPVEHRTRQVDRGVEGTEAVQQRGDAARLAAGVDDQHDRRAEQPGDLRGRPRTVGQPPVEQPHHALDDRDLGARRGAVPRQRRDPVDADERPGRGCARAGPRRACGSRGRCSPGPTLNGASRRCPRRRSAAMSPVATVVFPDPEAGAATTTAGAAAWSRRPAPVDRVRHVPAGLERSDSGLLLVASSTSSAEIASSTWPGLVAPMIGAVTASRCSTQASATCAGRSAAGLGDVRDRLHDRVVGVGRTSRRRSCRCPPGVVAARLRTPRQPSAGERAPRDHADALVEAERVHLPLLLAVDQVVVVLHATRTGSSRRGRPRAGPWRTARRTCWTRRCSAPCPRAPRRAAPPSSPRSACAGPSGGSGRGRRGRCRAAAARRRSTARMCLRDRPAVVRAGPTSG